jgi:hypothetical protein
MACGNEMPGEMEILLLCTSLKSQILVHTDECILEYGKEYDGKINVKYSKINERCGHYDALIESSEFAVIPEMISAMPSTSGEQKKARAGNRQRSQILTSSPYENGLSGSVNSKKARLSKCKKSANTKCKRPASKSKVTDIDDDIAEWCCGLCGEQRKEAIIQCNKCGQWVHELCADASPIESYTCDSAA